MSPEPDPAPPPLPFGGSRQGQKGLWVAAIVSGAVVAALVSGLISIWVARMNLKATRQLTEVRRDLDLIDRFAAVHFSGNNSYRLSVYIVRSITSDRLRRELRQFIFWDIMERRFARADLPKTFNPDDHDWHLLGDAMLDMKKDLQVDCWNGRDWFRWWGDQQDIANDRWAKQSKVGLDAVYAELDKRYFGKDWKTKEPRPRCAQW
jgi:hypothetical protein